MKFLIRLKKNRNLQLTNMRIPETFKLREKVRHQVDPLPDVTWTANRVDEFRVVKKLPIRRRLIDRLSPYIVNWKQNQFTKTVKTKLNASYNLLCVGERFMRGTFENRIRQHARDVESVLVQGCGFGDKEVHRWLRRGVKSVAGIELMNYESCWEKTAPMLNEAFGADVGFKQASVDDIPYGDGEFDVTSSSAVYEHVYRLKEASRESARILRQGGFLIHSIGPLYYCFGGDHCIATYGQDAGYDHLLLPEEEYRRRISDRNVFDLSPDPICNFWAENDRLSFARFREYLDVFDELFDVSFMLLVICDQALAFRDQHPSKWQQMLDMGLDEEDLLVKAIHGIWKKK